MSNGLRIILLKSGDDLARAFVGEARQIRNVLGPFEPLPVITSSSALSEVLRETYALATGCAASFEFTALVPFINGLLENRAEGRRVMTRTRLAHDLLGLFLSGMTATTVELASCERYLSSALSDEGRSARAVSLSFKLAGLYEEYSLSRPDWLKAWEEGRLLLAGAPSEIQATEIWQAALWRELRKKPGVLPVLEALRLAMSGWKHPRALILAGPDLVAESYRQVLAELSKQTEVVWLRLDPGEALATREDLELTLKAGAVLERRQAVSQGPELAVWLCPGLTREAETVALEVSRLVRGGADPRRILVMHPGSALDDAGAAFVQAFHSHGIPVSSHAVGEELDVIVRQFVLLVGSDAPRSLMVPWMSHPFVRSRHPDVPFDDAAGIFLEMGLMRRARSGDDEQERARTWEGGLDRLLSGFVRGDADLVEGPKGWVAPWHAGALDPQSLGALCHYMRGFLFELESLGAFKGPLGAWGARVRRALALWLRPDGRALAPWGRLMAGLGALEELSDPSVLLVWPEFRPFLEELVTAHLESADLVPGGLRLGDPSRLHALPCDTLFITGLNEGVFPAPDKPDALDLRPHDPRPGDAGRRKQDLARLQAAAGSCQRLRLTASDRDETTGSVCAPSGWLEDLAHRSAVAPVRVSLFRHETHPGEALGTSAGIEWAVSQARLKGIPTGDLPSDWKSLLGHADVRSLDRPLKPRRRILLHNLEAFLWCEAQGLARHTLGLRSAGDDRTLTTLEEMVPDLHVRERQLRLAAEGASDAPIATRNLHALLRHAALQGRGPSTRRASLWMDHDEAAMRRLFSFLPPDTRLEALRLGEARRGQAALPALQVGDADLAGVVDLTAPGLLLQWHPIASSDKHKKRRRILRGCLDHVVLSALGMVGPRRLLVIPAHGKADDIPLVPVPQETAIRWLEALQQDINSLSPGLRIHAGAFLEAQNPEDILDLLEKDADAGEWGSPYRGPIPDAELLPLPDTETVRRVHERRYELLKSLMRGQA